MAHPPPSTKADPVKPASSHISVRPDDSGPVEIRFLFEQQEKRLGGALGLSVLTHAGVIVLLVVIGYLMPRPVIEAFLPERNPEIVWLTEPGPGGGGGGGGNESPEPPAEVELPGPEVVTVPVEAPPEPVPEPEPNPEPEPEPRLQLNIPARTMAAATQITPGVLNSSGVSQGIGVGGGAGTGEGSGIGPGEGDGLGPGRGGGTGGGVFQLGSGVTPPSVITEVKPAYTAEAMRAKVQGTVLVNCVVLADGNVGDCEVVRSLDRSFGLDEEAIKAARQWRFSPGTRLGEPVAVLVTIQLDFTLR
jgi:periplasmic protein TonB